MFAGPIEIPSGGFSSKNLGPDDVIKDLFSYFVKYYRSDIFLVGNLMVITFLYDDHMLKMHGLKVMGILLFGHMIGLH